MNCDHGVDGWLFLCYMGKKLMTDPREERTGRVVLDGAGQAVQGCDVCV